MTRVYHRATVNICDILGQVCGDYNDAPPVCAGCPDYEEWKASKMTLKQWKDEKVRP